NVGRCDVRSQLPADSRHVPRLDARGDLPRGDRTVGRCDCPRRLRRHHVDHCGQHYLRPHRGRPNGNSPGSNADRVPRRVGGVRRIRNDSGSWNSRGHCRGAGCVAPPSRWRRSPLVCSEGRAGEGIALDARGRRSVSVAIELSCLRESITLVASRYQESPMRTLTVLACLALFALSGSAARAADDPAKIFEERILPIFKSPDPSSCVRCHLASVDLKNYILPSAKDTFLALRDQGLIDLDKPENSKILTLINRGANDPKAAGLITAKQQKAEYEAFAAWIKAWAADPALKNAPKPDNPPALATKPSEVVRYARKDRMLESFEKNVWSLRFRCMNCHTEGTPANTKHVQEYGERVAWFKKGGPEATME